MSDKNRQWIGGLQDVLAAMAAEKPYPPKNHDVGTEWATTRAFYVQILWKCKHFVGPHP